MKLDSTKDLLEIYFNKLTPQKIKKMNSEFGFLKIFHLIIAL